SSGLLREVPKTFGRTPHREAAVAWLEKRQVNYIKRNAFIARVVNHAVRFGDTGVVQSVADQNDDAALRTNARQVIQHLNRLFGCVKDSRTLVCMRGKVEGRLGLRRFAIKSRGDHGARGKLQHRDARLVTEVAVETDGGVSLAGNDLTQASGLIESKDHGDAIHARREINPGSYVVLIFERQILFL